MNSRFLMLCLATLLILACNIPPLATAIVPTETSVVVPTSTVDMGGVVALNNTSFQIPIGVANDALSEMAAAATEADGGPWGAAPSHLKFQLTGYQVRDRFHEPQVLVYPTDEYAQASTGAAQQIERIKAIVAGAPLSKDTLPIVPFFNAGPLFTAHMQVLDFQTGRGVRMLTQYAQYAAPINNHELFYHFQGLTSDGRFYVVVIFPVASSILAEDEKPESPVPPGGIPFPTGTGPDPAYYDAVTQALNAMYPDSFNPSLFQLDTLIQSLRVISE